MKKQRSTKSSANSIVIFLFVLFIFLIISVLFLRSNNSLIGDDAYFINRISHNLLEGKFASDDLSFQGREVLYNLGLPAVILGLSIITKLDTLMISKLLLILFGIISLYLVYLILKHYKLTDIDMTIVLFILILSPSFIYLFTVLTEYSAVVLLSLLGFLLYIKDRRKLSFVVMSLIGLFNLSASILIWFLVFVFLLNKKLLKQNNFVWIWFLVNLIILAIKFMIGHFEWISGWWMITSLDAYISDFGSKFGISIVVLILALFGIVFDFETKKREIIVYILFILLILLSLYFYWAIFILSFFVLLFAFDGTKNLMKRVWENNFLKNFTFFILACSILFSGISYLNVLNKEGPSQNMIDAMNFLNENTLDNSVVFSSIENGNYITGIANRPVVIDKNEWFVFGINRRIDDYGLILDSEDVEETRRLLDSYGVDYILIDKNMKENIWQYDEKGLLFLTKYSKAFKIVFANEDVEIWRYFQE